MLVLTNVCGAQSLIRSGSEFSILDRARGDQINATLAFGPTNGLIIWEDNFFEGGANGINGSGLGAVLMNKNSFTPGTQKIHANRTPRGDQMLPKAAYLSSGKTVCVWESPVAASTSTFDIYARIGNGNSGTNFFTADIRVNTVIKDQQVNPVVSPLHDGSAVIAWASYGQDGSMMGIYARRILATGALGVKETLVNQNTLYNQRNPAIATLADGHYVVTWVSEQQRRYDTVDIYARVFATNGVALGDEFLVNTSTNICNSPVISATANGGFTIAWQERDLANKTNSWDITARSFAADGTPATTAFKVNNYTYGDQYRPQIASSPTGCLVVWTSLAQDGSREGVYGRFLPGGNVGSSREFLVNTTTASQQVLPAVAWNGVDRFLVVWSSLVVDYGFDLFGQAYAMSATE